MDTNNNNQDQNILKIIRTPADVIELAKTSGYNTRHLLETCGVKYNTFQNWKRANTIPNLSALILFNYIAKNPTVYGSIMFTSKEVLNEPHIIIDELVNHDEN